MEYWGNGLYAWKNGVTGIGENQMNNLIAAQSSVMIFDGTLVDENTGSGTTEYNLSLSDLYDLFSVSGQSTIGRVELEIKKYGSGSNLTLQIMHGTPPNGEVLKEITYPAKLFSDGYISLPVDLSGLSAGSYWFVLKQSGDSINHLRWVGEADQYETKHFRVFANTTGTFALRHAIYGENAMTRIDYDSSGLITEIWRWLPAPDGDWMICEGMFPTYQNGVVVRWEVF